MPSSAMSSRRTVVSGIGRSISVSAMVPGSTLHQAVAAVARDPGRAVFVDLDAVGLGIRRRHGHEPGIAARGIQPADHVALLQREPEDAVGIEDRGVRVLRRRIGHPVLGDLPGVRVEHADRRVLIARVPDVAGIIEGHGVRHRPRRQRVLDHRAGRGIDPADQVAPLPGPPDGAVRRLDRIARALAERRHLPFLERDRGLAGHQPGRPALVRREMRREVLRDPVLLLRAPGQIDHRADQLPPAVLGVAGAARDLIGLMARRADGLDHLLAGAVGQIGRLALRLCGDGNQPAGKRPRERQNRRSEHGRLPPALGFGNRGWFFPGEPQVKWKPIAAAPVGVSRHPDRPGVLPLDAVRAIARRRRRRPARSSRSRSRQAPRLPRGSARARSARPRALSRAAPRPPG